jgi:hypothetical protein
VPELASIWQTQMCNGHRAPACLWQFILSACLGRHSKGRKTEFFYPDVITPQNTKGGHGAALFFGALISIGFGERQFLVKNSGHMPGIGQRIV